MKITASILVVLALTATSANAQSRWKITDETSALDGRQTYLAVIDADNTVANIIGRDERPFLEFACNDKGLFGVVGWPDLVTERDSHAEVTWKLDDMPVQHGEWFATSKSVGQLGRNGLSWLNQLAKGKKLLIRLDDRHGGQDATFDLDGVAEVATTINARSCG